MKFLQKHSTSHAWWWLGGIMTLFSVIVIGNMTRWSIWFDEAFSAYITRFSFTDITHYTAADVHPPFYYWLLKVWTMLFGTSEIAFRSLSLTAGIVAIIGVFVLIRRLFQSEKWALVASFAVALSPMVVRFSHEARMYLLVLAIVVWATYVLVRALEKNASRRWWVGYTSLIVIGMLTHYFVALAWLSHWVWRYIEYRHGGIKKFFDRPWLWVHISAIALYATWLPIAVRQFLTVQQGFWIPPLSAYTPIDYTSNTLIYQEYGKVLGWWAVAYVLAMVACVYVVRSGWQQLVKRSRSGAYLLATISLAPPLLLMIASLPPLRSSFIDRYVLYAQASGMVLVALCFAASYMHRPSRRLAWAGAIITATLIVGIINVYLLGNYNKNSSTSIRVRETVQKIEASSVDSESIITATPWIYYEAVFYETPKHQVYFLENTTDNYKISSLKMLEDNDKGKIINLDAFTKTHRYVWYLDNVLNSETVPPNSKWKRLKSVEAYDSIDHNSKYRASLFDTQAN